MAKFDYYEGVRVTKLEPEEFEQMMMVNVERAIQRVQKIPNRLFGAMMNMSGEAT